MTDLPHDDLRDRIQSALAPAFTLEQELGGGGMSRVFVATETALARRVAVKILPPDLLQGASAERFAREVALAAQLQDPHIVPVLVTGSTPDGIPYYTMPFVEGESLRARLQRGAVPLEEALRILRDVAEALEYAHARGVVHRDIKPENILLSGRNAVVTDFGIAKALSDARAAVPGGTLTSIGLSLGTPAYMAPEQAAGETVDQRADLYAWGVVAYELLAGAHPFAHRATPQQLLVAQLTEVPRPLEQARPGLPPALGALVMRCLSKAADERPESATALLGMLGTVGTAGSASTGDASGTRAPVGTPAAASRRGPAIAAGALLVLVALGGAWVAQRDAEGGAAGAEGAPAAADLPAVAVLPFEHQGDSADAYITEGLTDELRGKLAGVPDLAVIARGSSNQYRNTDKPPREIAQELGVRWLLTATVQVLGSGETRRVIVRPELVEVASDGQPRTRWGEPFDAQGADALRLQGEIATRVVDAMQVKLVGDDRARTIAVPTRDPAAYDAYLRGRAATAWGARSQPAALDRAIPHLEEAVRRDSTFTQAWVSLASARSLRVANARSRDAATEAQAVGAREAAERVERLAPGSPSALLARAGYLRNVKEDLDSARVLYERGARLAPGDFRFVGNLGLLLLQDLGRSREAVDYLVRAAAIDPRNPLAPIMLAEALIGAGRLPEARAAAERGITLAPGNYNAIEPRVMVELAAGDTAAARAVLARLAPTVTDGGDLMELGDSFGWLLDERTTARVLALGDADVGSDRAEWAANRAVLLFFRGDATGARTWGDTARRLLLRDAASGGLQVQVDLGFAEALAGRADAALAAAVSGRAILRTKSLGPGTIFASALADFAAIAAMAGARDSAIAWLTEASSIQSMHGGQRLALDPVYASLRDDPRFQALVTAPRP